MLEGFLKGWFEDIFGNDAFANMEKVLSLSPSSDFSSAWKAVEAIYNTVMVPLALSLMIIWFCTKFMEKATADQMTFQQIFLLFAKLLIAKLLIDNGLNIFSLMWSLGISLTKEVAGVFASGGVGQETIEVLWKEYTGKGWNESLDFWPSLGMVFELLLPWAVSGVIKGICYYIAYTRLIEMFVRVCAAPIALSDFMSEGLNGAGWKYLKNFLAVCLQGLLIVVISRLHGYVLGGAAASVSGGFPTIIVTLAVGFATVGLMMKSLTLSKELLGTA